LDLALRQSTKFQLFVIGLSAFRAARRWDLIGVFKQQHHEVLHKLRVDIAFPSPRIGKVLAVNHRPTAQGL
jgi:hypothetical protein